MLWEALDTVQHDLFSDTDNVASEEKTNFKIPREFIKLAEAASCHSCVDRFSLLYRVLWRLVHDDKYLLYIKTDQDVLQLHKLVKAVYRDAYKIKAFLRFRNIADQEPEQFVAWYEPDHYTLERVVPFFKKRFRHMRWSILTPYRAAYWDMKKIIFQNNPDPSLYPNKDRVEQYWLTYCAHIFNPARPKKNAMLSSMPKKYWKNMPETVLIDDLLKTAEARTKDMINKVK